MTMSVDMPFSIDVIPGRSGIEVEMIASADGGLTMVRFQANHKGRRSLWSGWFTVTDEPVRLTWAAFEWPRPWWRPW